MDIELPEHCSFPHPQDPEDGERAVAAALPVKNRDEDAVLPQHGKSLVS